MSIVVLPGANDSFVKGIPDYDKAEELFRIRYKYAVTHANGMERLAFRVLPYQLIRSFALAFDPTERFRLGSLRITPVNRTRTRTVSSLSFARKMVGVDRTQSITQNPNNSLCVWTQAAESTSSTPISTALTDTPKLVVTARDTTARTRPVTSDMGEFESFTYSLAVPERTVNRVDTYRQWTQTTTCNLVGYQRQDTSNRRSTQGGCAYISAADVATLRSQTISRTELAIANRLSKMLTTSLTSSQRYTIIRNVIELKDLPRSILSLGRTLKDIEAAWRAMPSGLQQALMRAKTAKHVPNEWLSFWFGWRATYKAVTDLIEAPEKVTKDINFLIARKGIPTVVRRSIKFAGDGATTPAFTFNPGTIFGTLWSDDLQTQATRNSWEHEIKLVVSMIFDFPEVAVPKLRRDLYLRKMGFIPTPTDLYNLTPWTWLVDWFTGLGNYVELIDNINTDKSTINWGLVTGITTGNVTTEGTFKYDNRARTSYQVVPNAPVLTDTLTPVKRVIPCVLDYKCIVRKDIPAALGVKSLLKPETLSPYQQSIIGAILAQRSGKRS